jgi:STELLO glycosyltransferases
MKDKIALVVTTIAGPDARLARLAEGCKQSGYEFIVIGDEASPKTFTLDGCRFYSLDEQRELDLNFARVCPTRHYARKNIGYLLALRQGATVIIEIDDDNIPYESFWSARERMQSVRTNASDGFVNVYRYFSEANVWPRGFPLEHINDPPRDFDDLPTEQIDCPIQQALADSDPDVDAIYRLTQPLPLTFTNDRRVALKRGSWCPFNSQNTAWWADAFPLLYLPAYCSFRMTDIWRSFVAQRIAWTNNWSVLFQEPTCRQERNQHDLMRDFEQELPGYLHNKKICAALDRLRLLSGVEHVGENLRTCYKELVRMGVHHPKEIDLLEAWIEDLSFG